MTVQCIPHNGNSESLHVNGGSCSFATNNFATNFISMRMLYDIYTTLAQECPAVYTLEYLNL